MTFPLYSPIDDNFDRHDGSLDRYVDNNNVALPYEKHYDLRAFHTSNLTVPWTTLDNQWWSGWRYSSFTSSQIGNPRSIVNATARGRTQGELDTFQQGTFSSGTGSSPIGITLIFTGAGSTGGSGTGLDALTQADIENVVISSGNEEWPTTDGAVTVGKDSAYRYSNSIRIALITGNKIVNSYYFDDIQTDFSDTEYYIELVLRSFPSQTAAAHLNLSASSIDISSDVNFDPAQTDSLIFSNSINPLIGTTGNFDTVARWPISSLVKADRSKLTAIRFNLTSIGSWTFIAQTLRVVPTTQVFRVIGLDTKRQILSRQVPKEGGNEVSGGGGEMYFKNTRPQNINTYTAFRSGHLPNTGIDDNILRQYYRFNPTTGDRIEIRLAARSTQTILFIDQRINNVTTNLASTSVGLNSLSEETGYYLDVNILDDTINVTIYNQNGLALGSQVGTLMLSATTALIDRGYVGMSFEPYNYDFSLSSFGTSIAEFGKFISTTFASRTPVKGATLYPRTSLALNLLTDNTFEAFGDSIVTTTDNNTYTIDRDGSANQGGVRFGSAITIGDTSQVVATGAIFPISVARGQYRLGLIDENDSVAWIFNIPNLLPNQWNEFNVLLPSFLNPVIYWFHIQQFGSYADTFRIRDVALQASTIAWEATSNSPNNWQSFFNVLNDRWSAINFDVPGRALAVRATAKSDTAFITGYNLVPRYFNGS